MNGMNGTSAQERQALRRMSRDELAEHQLRRFNALLEVVLKENAFYREKLASCPAQLDDLSQLADLPWTSKQELVVGASEGLPSNLTWPPDRYVRYHQTSGTSGRPLVVLDTAEDWRWWVDAWQYVLDAAEITEADRALLAFSFGPFIGFWSAHDALVERGAMVIPGGGTHTLGRIRLLESTQATVLLCTPTYALHMAQVAREHAIDLRALSVRCVIVAGEPGGSVPATRERIASAFGARVIDHGGASEIGPWGFGDRQGRGLHIIESEFLAEFVSVETGRPATQGELSHLVLTSLGRAGAPIIRYRTGDLVQPTWPDEGDVRFVLLAGGVLGRADDMMIIRGVNVFPSSIEQIIHGFPEVEEFRLTATREGEMDQLRIDVEDRLNRPERIVEELSIVLGLRVDVVCAPLGSLPRFEGKGMRFMDERGD